MSGISNTNGAIDSTRRTTALTGIAAVYETPQFDTFLSLIFDEAPFDPGSRRISPDDEGSHEKFRQKMGIPYPLVADTDKEVSKSYGVYGLKKFMGREYMGINRSTFIIDKEGRIVKIFKKVRPAGHSQEVFQTLRG